MAAIAETNQMASKSGARSAVGEAMMLGSTLLSASSPEQGRSALSRLLSLLSDSSVAQSDKARSIIASLVSMGEKVCTHLDEVAATEMVNQMEEQRRYAVSKESDALAYQLSNQKFMQGFELDYFQSIKPDETRVIAHLDEKGNKIGEREIDGQRLRDSMAIANGYQNYDKLDAEGKKAFNVLVYGKGRENGPLNDDERKQGALRIREAVVETEGDAAKKALSEEKEREASKRLRTSIDSIKQADDVESRGKVSTGIPAMDRAVKQAVEDKRKESREIVGKNNKERMEDIKLATKPERGATPPAPAKPAPAKTPAVIQSTAIEASPEDLGELPPAILAQMEADIALGR